MLAGRRVIEAQNITVHYGGGSIRRTAKVTALEDVSLSVEAGACHGLVGESGSGKSTLGRVLLGLTAPNRGRVAIAGFDPARLARRQRPAFCRSVQCVFQDSGTVLNPRLSVGRSVREGLDIQRCGTRADRDAAVAALFERVGLSQTLLERFPHQLSGGQRQRVNIARALSVSPKVLVADEPLSALDVSVQAQILDLLHGIQRESGLTIVLITHDLKVAQEICDTVTVLEAGRTVEHGRADDVFANPKHSTTRRLINSLPTPKFA
ncbi:MAG: ABC transporter ATP-binding protein [Pseudomonadota bacterium]